jgi:hypothetical protein
MMAIQFPCRGCRQPIEVDDELADTIVSCPFCQSTVRAPAETTLSQESPPVAREVSDGAAPAAGTFSLSIGEPHDAVALRSNRIGNWALAVSAIAWVFFGVTLIYGLILVADVLIEQNVEQPTPEQIKDALEFIAQDELKANRIGVLTLLMGVSAVMGVVLSVFALRKRDCKKGTAIAALILGGTLVVCPLAAAI